ncbi:sugar phosphate nucleotidyltransferase [Pontibacter sp. CAU 1760]
MDIVGLVPAAGFGNRLSPLPCSKELFPIGFAANADNGEPHPKVVSQYLLEQMQQAGAHKAYFVLRKGKWDIPAYYGDGNQLKLPLAYLLMRYPYGFPFSIDQAYPFTSQNTILFGFPDILIEPNDAYGQLLDRQVETGADLVLGCYRVSDTAKWDMVKFKEGGVVERVVHKPLSSGLQYNWVIACWGPVFTEFMHQHLQQILPEFESNKNWTEVSLGEIINAAIGNGLYVESVCFKKGNCTDVGTPVDLRNAIRKLT